MFDILLVNCSDHELLEDIEEGEGLYAHYPVGGQCHCLVSSTQLNILDSNKINYLNPSDSPLTFTKSSVPIHTFGSKVRDKKIMDSEALIMRSLND